LRAHSRSDEPPPTAPAEPAYTLCADIPESYNDSFVRAIPKDPQSTFVYWEMPAAGQEDQSLFADKGTAHVGNDEVVRIGQQLNEKQKQRQAENCRHADSDCQQDHSQYDYNKFNRPMNWDNGNNYNFDHNNQQHHNNSVDNYQENYHGYHQINWDGGNNYGFAGAGHQQQRHSLDNHQEGDHGYHQINWDNGNHYSFDDIYQHLYINHVDCQHDWNGGYHYSREDGYQNNHTNDIYRLIWNNCGDYARYRREDDDAAFSEMLSALIDRCNRYIADYRQSGETPSARALSSGLLCGASEESRP
jgi:hypothetical protein